jgi:hypothetical protein
MEPNVKEIRASLKPVGDPYDWENNDEYMHPDNFKIRLFNMLDWTQHYLKTGDTSKLTKADDFIAEMEQMSKETEKNKIRICIQNPIRQI